MAERTFSPAAANSDPVLETRLLASLNPDTWAEAQFARLNADMFSNRECRALYEQMEQAAAKSEAFPKVDGESVGDVGDAARRVVELYQRRLMAVALDYLKDGLSENRDVTDVISRVETALAAARLAAGALPYLALRRASSASASRLPPMNVKYSYCSFPAACPT